MPNINQLTFEAIAINGDVAYASDHDRNGLFKVNMDSGECEFIRLFDGELVNKRRLHCAAIWEENKIYFVPGSANRITIYCPDDNSLETVEIPLPKTEQYTFYRAQYKFIRAIKEEDNLWLVPSTYPGIIKFNMITKSIQIFDEWIKGEEYLFRLGVALDGDKIIAASGINNLVLIFDMKKQIGQSVRIGSKNNGVMSICKVKDEYWFAPRLSGAIVAWNPDNDNMVEYDDFPEGFEEADIIFSAVYSFEDKVVFVPTRASCGLVYSEGELQIDNSLRDKYGQGSIQYLFETDDGIFFRKVEGIKDNKYFEISKIDNKVREHNFFYCDNGERDRCMLQVMSEQREIVKEATYVGLKEIINGLV